MAANTTCSPFADDAFGPVVDACARSFDFTLLFEETILSALPSSVFLVLASWRIIKLRGRKPKVTGAFLRLVKLVAIGLLLVLKVTLAALWAQNHDLGQSTRASVADAILGILSCLIILALSFLEHSRTIGPSLLLGGYLFFSALFDAVQVRTLWLKSVQSPISGIFTASFAVKVAILALEETSKKRWILPDEGAWSSEETSGLFGRTCFAWLNRLFWTGYSTALSVTKLPVIDRKLLSEALWERAGAQWETAPKVGNNALLVSVFSALKWSILAPIIPYLVNVALQLAQPFLISTIMAYLSAPDDGSELQKNIGYGLIAAYGLVYICIAVATAWAQHLVFRYVTMMRGSLVTLIYRKTTAMSVVAAEDAAAVTLMSTDVERIVNGMAKIHDIWSTLLQMAVALFLLYRQVGVVFIAPLILFLLCGVGAGVLSGFAGAFQASWMGAIQKRVAVTSSALGSMKGVKLSGLTAKITKIIQDLRLAEIASAAKFRGMLLIIVTLSYIPGTISPVITFGAYTAIAQKEHTTLDSNRIFTSLALLSLVTQPLNELFAHLPSIFAAMACFTRIQTFLLSADSKNLGHDAYEPSVTAASIQDSQSGSEMEHPVVKSTTKSTTKPWTKPVFDVSENSHAIELRNAIFGWKTDEKPVLADVSLNIPRSKLTMIVGPVASGKSTLLKAILGETPIGEGYIRRSSSSIAFCDQTPWMINETLRRNITGFAHFDSAWYGTVIRACALEQDIALFPEGDQVMIGSKGITLSGGQKQRVAIARAVYAKREVALFDDVFSGLDFETQTRVFDSVFGKSGLLKKQNTTVIFVTHAVHLLSQADFIVALDTNGSISGQGTFETLNQEEGYVRELGLTAKTEDTESTEDVPEEDKLVHLPSKVRSVLENAVDEKTQRLGDWSVYKYYFRAISLKSTFLFFALQISFVFLLKFPEIWLSWWGEFNAEHPNEQIGKYLGVYTLLQVGSLIALAVTCWYTVLVMAVNSGIKLHWTLLDKAIRAPLSFFSTTDTGSIINRFSQDIQLIDAELPISLLNAAANALVCVAQALMIIPASYQLVAAYPFLFGVLWFVQKFYLRTSRQLRFLDLDAKSPMYSQFLETLSGLTTIRAFAWQDQLLTQMDDRLNVSQKPFYLLYSIQRWLNLVLDLTVAGLAIILISVAVALRGSVNAGFAGVALYNIMGLSSAMKAAVSVWTVLETSIGAVARVKTFEESTPCEDLPEESQTPPSNWPEAGEITVNNVVASYSEDSSPVLSGVSVTFKPGQKIGICGRSGSGKSSFILALLRLINCKEGTIYIDGVDTSTIPRGTLRTRLNALPQEPPFLNGSVRLNCDPHGGASDEEIIEALRIVQLLEVVETKGGLDADLTDDFFSHGQKQVFCLARAILHPSKIVVMDEATSSVDVDTEKIMQDIIRDRFRDATVISVAHRLNTILDYDRILVLDQGHIIEDGSPLELLAHPSAFKTLFESFHGKESEEEK